MPEPLKIAVVGLGRMGAIHAFHAYELARDTGSCEFAALVERQTERANQFLRETGLNIPIFQSIDELIASKICQAAVIVTPTEEHRNHATKLISAGFRVLLEKPLTGTLEGDREFADELDKSNPNSLMLGFQRRFDAPIQYAKQLMDSGAIGRVFKIYSALEDSGPAPNGFKSGGILSDMSIHNVDEVIWLSGGNPTRVLAIGSNIYGHALTTAIEDFDDALLCAWFDNGLLAHVQVSRNHVSGYRVETIIFGENGQIHIGHFDQKLTSVTVEAYGRRGCGEPFAKKTFQMRDYQRPLPEFIDRFGAAYKAELAAFVDCCRNGSAFLITHRDGLRAQEVISAGVKNMLT